jgi:hypothetical protein
VLAAWQQRQQVLLAAAAGMLRLTVMQLRQLLLVSRQWICTLLRAVLQQQLQLAVLQQHNCLWWKAA